MPNQGQHTPGPWDWACDSYGKVQHSRKYDCVFTGNGSAANPLRTIAARIPRTADARLIAAAPEMLALLRDWVNAYGPDPDSPFELNWMDEARQLLASLSPAKEPQP